LFSSIFVPKKRSWPKGEFNLSTGWNFSQHMFLPISSTIVASWMLCRFFILSPLWGQYLYTWSPSHPKHFMGYYLVLVPKEFFILGSICASFPCICAWGFFLNKGGLNPFFLWSIFPLFLSSFPCSTHIILGIPYGFLQSLRLIVGAIICLIYCNHLICQYHFVTNRVDALYVSITYKFICLMSISYIRKHSKTNTLFSHSSSNTLHIVQIWERKTHKQSPNKQVI